MKKFAVLVAGGHGARMGNELPKQFLPLCGKPILLQTLLKFADEADEILLVLPASHIDFWNDQQLHFDTHVQHRVVAGGNTRTESVKNALSVLPEQGVVAIHDAVRPLVSKSLIQAAFATAVQYGSAVPMIEVRESLRIKKGTDTVAVNREDYLAVQTPQCFDLSRIKTAYKSLESTYSDDASVFSAAGNKIKSIKGDPSNIKITYKEDLLFATAYLQQA
ncbi:MAG TPA: 2-C-methyl-D-erythritol 4-phosphate cytidylyltransferase [Bacteroidia bacterium]|nr:2-C-methyl-D-erythritol 4-phosphate cytidylyltransferase [Bacteroidia bacterium]